MKKSQLFRYIKDIFSEIDLSGYTYVLDKKINCGNGYCDDYYYKDKEIHIGVKELKGFIHKEVPDLLVVKVFVNIFHELKHYTQQKDFFSKYEVINDTMKNMYYNYLACIIGCYGYYNPEINPYNYYNNPRELEAELKGIIGAYDFLLNIYSEEKSEELIMMYINSKINIKYYIDLLTPVESLGEIEKLFNKAIYKSKTNKRYYNTNYLIKDKILKYYQDINDEFIFKVNEENNPIIQDKILAGAYIKYIEDKNKDEIIKNTFLYQQNKDELLATINGILYKNINMENSYEFQTDRE